MYRTRKYFNLLLDETFGVRVRYGQSQEDDFGTTQPLTRDMMKEFSK